MSETSLPAPENEHRLSIYFSYLVVLGMVACFAYTAVTFLHWLVPTWNVPGMVAVCLIAAVEALASRRLIRQLPTAERQIIFYRLTEWVILLALLKVYVELGQGGMAALRANMGLWPVDFPFNILNLRFFLSAITVLAVWYTSLAFDSDISLMGTVDTSLLDERARTTSVRTLILRRFLNIGMSIVILAGIPPQQLVPTGQAVPSNSAPAVILYFLLGVILLSLTRYSTLVTNWKQNRISIPTQISRRWLAYSALLIAGLAVVVLVLPTNYGMGLLDTLNTILHLLYNAIIFIYQLIYILINALMRLLLPKNSTLLPPVVLPAVPTQSPLTPAPQQGGINWRFIQSVIIWVVLSGLVIVALRQYILYNQDLADELKRFRPLRWLSLFWKRITASVRQANKSVGIFVQSSLRRLREAARPQQDVSDWQYLNPHRLSAREKIIFYYLALVRRANEAGLPRQEDQTPYEYAAALKARLDSAAQANPPEDTAVVADLTESFVEARYSLHDIPAEAGKRAESLWVTIRNLFMAMRKKKNEEKK